MYFEDLTQFSYLKFLHPKDLPPNLLNIGWLDQEHDFPKKKTDSKILEIIKKMILTERSLNMTRGFHFCEFCEIIHPEDGCHMPVELECNGENLFLGSGIIIVQCKTHSYAFPNLMHHYISEHNYKPPDVFIQDIMLYNL